MKKSKKKVVKKEKKSVSKKTTEIVVKVQAVPAGITPNDLEPMKDGGKFMIPKTWMSEKQVLKLVQRTPEKYIYKRPAKGGGVWSYVTGNYVERILNYTFGWNWDFEVVAHGREVDQIWVHGKLTVKDDHGHHITKSQFGRADIKFKKETKIMLDFGNDLKAATTDALKKCSSLLGIASDIYGKNEYKQETNSEVKEVSIASSSNLNSKDTVVGPDNEPVLTCQNCDKIITPQEAEFSKKLYKKPLCRECQKEVKK